MRLLGSDRRWGHAPGGDGPSSIGSSSSTAASSGAAAARASGPPRAGSARRLKARRPAATCRARVAQWSSGNAPPKSEIDRSIKTPVFVLTGDTSVYIKGAYMEPPALAHPAAPRQCHVHTAARWSARRAAPSKDAYSSSVVSRSTRSVTSPTAALAWCHPRPRSAHGSLWPSHAVSEL